MASPGQKAAGLWFNDFRLEPSKRLLIGSDAG
jgi:hypothetical protein